MKPNKITSLQYSTIIFFLLNSFLMNVGYHSLTSYSYNDSILDILLGGTLIFLFSIFLFTFQRNKKDSILDTINKHFPKTIQIPILLLLLFIIGFSAIYSLSILTSFIHYYILKEVESFIILVTLTCTILYIVSKGIATIGKISEIFFYIYLFIFIISSFGLVKYMDLSNLKPLFTIDMKNHLHSSITYFLSSVIPLFLLTIIPSKQVEWESKNKKLPYLFILLSILLVLIQLLFIISVLGIHLTNIYSLPDMVIYKKISVLNVLERIEVILAFNNLLNSLFFIMVGVYFLKEIIGHFISKKKEHIILALIGIICILLSNFVLNTLSIYLQISILLFIILGIFIMIHYLSKYIRS